MTLFSRCQRSFPKLSIPLLQTPTTFSPFYPFKNIRFKHSTHSNLQTFKTSSHLPFNGRCQVPQTSGADQPPSPNFQIPLLQTLTTFLTLLSFQKHPVSNIQHIQIFKHSKLQATYRSIAVVRSLRLAAPISRCRPPSLSSTTITARAWLLQHST
jgi:hypothetical protein